MKVRIDPTALPFGSAAGRAQVPASDPTALPFGSAAVPAIVLLALLITGCTITHRSQDYACTTQADCATGRTCSGGFCVVNGSQIDAPVHIDAPIHIIDAPACPAGCTSCDVMAKQCTIDCTDPNAGCTAQVTCPAGYNCDIKCDAANSCRNNVNCQEAASCIIECSGNGACRGVVCGPGSCDVQCTGQNSCRTVDCSTSCKCDVNCAAIGSCSDTITCPILCDSGLGCSSDETGCSSCN